MEGKLHFKGTCPKCGNREIFQVIGRSTENESQYAEEFIYDDWREYDYFLFSISSLCNSCKHIISANVAASYDYKKNSKSELSDYANSEGELICNENLQILFDYPPLLPSQHTTSPISINVLDLHRQAKLCYKMQAWDAVGVLCRKIIDIKSLEMWRQNNSDNPPNKLFQRIAQIWGIDTRKPIDDQLDFSLEAHQKFHNANSIRLLGNDAAHSPIIFDCSSAEAILAFTSIFLNSN